MTEQQIKSQEHRILRLRSALSIAADWLDPTTDPTRLTNREMAAFIRKELLSDEASVGASPHKETGVTT